MKLKSAKIAAGSALILQIAAIIITILIFFNQQTVKGILSGNVELLGWSVPVANFVINTVPVIIYLAFFVFFIVLPHRIGAASVPFLVILCFLKIVLPLLSGLENLFIAPRGAAELAGLSLLNQAISQSTGFLTTIAFALFCFSAGICYAASKEEKENREDSLW